ncbi:sulfotransferase [Vallitalea okinawensis]|uniref:sulfotransferase n=1 Tax=Vallitalea okinawensis TaxID=2078660 RepID=UPI000CFD4991|nr:sulfotransferase [Vallitalea okinawensis]
MNYKKKYRIFINSTGRTGTQFFAKNMDAMIDNSVSFHEPGTPWPSKPKKLLRQIKDYGLYHLTLGQNKNTHSFYKLSRDYVTGDISRDEAKENIINISNKTIKFLNKQIYIESSGHIYGLLDLIDEIYDDTRFVFVVRDPRTWINSALKKKEYSLYGFIELFFKKISLQPSCFKNDPYKHEWNCMSKFEKYCWFYNKMNEIAISSMEGKSNFKIFKYEDIFLSEQKSENFRKLLDFATDFENSDIKVKLNPELLNKKVDSRSYKKKKLDWENWNKEKALLLQKHCGKWMDTFGYGKEDHWKDLISQSKIYPKNKLELEV